LCHEIDSLASCCDHETNEWNDEDPIDGVFGTLPPVSEIYYEYKETDDNFRRISLSGPSSDSISKGQMKRRNPSLRTVALVVIIGNRFQRILIQVRRASLGLTKGYFQDMFCEYDRPLSLAAKQHVSLLPSITDKWVAPSLQVIVLMRSTTSWLNGIFDAVACVLYLCYNDGKGAVARGSKNSRATGC
jgi:hypothetical protein